MASKACVRKSGKNKGKLRPGWRFNKAGNCVKKKSGRKCGTKRKTIKVERVTVALPCKAKSLTSAQRGKLDSNFSTAEWGRCAAKKGCRVVFFTAGGKPAMRMPGRKLRSKAPGTRGRPMPCVNKKGKITKCRGGAKRMRKASAAKRRARRR